MNPRRLISLATVVAAVLSASTASAHTLLKTPSPLSGDDDAKMGPCGCSFAPGAAQPCDANYTVTTVTAGTSYKVTWTETVQHNGDFRVAFSSKAPEAVTVADMDGGVLWEGPDQNPAAPADISQTITVPNTPCDLCTIQVRQFMEGAAAPYYFTCAAVKIVAPSGTGGMGGMGGMTNGGTTGNGSTSAFTAATVGGAGPQYQPEPLQGGCSVSDAGVQTDATLLLPGVLAAGWLAARRVRRRR